MNIKYLLHILVDLSTEEGVNIHAATNRISYSLEVECSISKGMVQSIKDFDMLKHILEGYGELSISEIKNGEYFFLSIKLF